MNKIKRENDIEAGPSSILSEVSIAENIKKLKDKGELK